MPGRSVAEISYVDFAARQSGLSGQWLAELIKNPDLLKPPEAIVDKLAWRGRLTFLAAREKAGKSTLLAAAAASVTQGQAFFGGAAREPGNVLWVGLEDSPADMIQRFLKFGGDPARICLVSHLAGIDHLRREAARSEGFALCVVDTLAALVFHTTGGDENDAAQMTAAISPVLELARQGGAAWILTGHAKKEAGAGYRGSSAIGAQADMIVEMGEASETERTFRLRGRWHVPNFTAVLEVNRYRVSGTGTLTALNKDDTRIVTYIAQHPGCAKVEVQTGLAMGRSEVWKHMEKLVRMGLVVNRGTDARPALYVPDPASQFRDPPPTSVPSVLSVPQRTQYAGSVPVRSGTPPKGGAPVVRSPYSQVSGTVRGEAWDGDEPDTLPL